MADHGVIHSGARVERITESVLRASPPPAVDPNDGLWCFTPNQVKNMLKDAAAAGLDSREEF